MWDSNSSTELSSPLYRESLHMVNAFEKGLELRFRFLKYLDYSSNNVVVPYLGAYRSGDFLIDRTNPGPSGGSGGDLAGRAHVP